MSADAPVSPENKSKPKVWVIVVVILAVLFLSCACLGLATTLLAPALFAAREKARLQLCANNLRLQALCLTQYSLDKRGFPNPSDGDGFGAYEELLEANYLDEPRTCFCPAQEQPVGELSSENCGYICLQIKAPKDPPPRFPLAWCKAPHPNGKVNVAFADGSVEAMTEEAFADTIAKALEKYGRRELPK